MPPKKAVAATEGDDGDKTFRWSAENDRKLLILTLGRTLSTDDYNKLVEAMPGSNYNGVRIRVSKFRVEQRKLFEELGWENLESAPAKPKTAGAPRKRKANAEGGDEGEGIPKKKTAKGKGAKGKKAAETVEEKDDDEEDLNKALNIKSEEVEA